MAASAASATSAASSTKGVRNLWDAVTAPFRPTETPTPALILAGPGGPGGEHGANTNPQKTQAVPLPDYSQLLHSNFTCHINGSEMPLKDLTYVMTSSFRPVEHVPEMETQLNPDTLYVSGRWRLEHHRAFIGWTPQKSSDTVIDVPYAATIVACGSHVRRLHMVAPYVNSFLAAGMPQRLESVLRNQDAMKMFCALRGIGVKPEVITYNALLGVAVRTATWGQALGLS